MSGASARVVGQAQHDHGDDGLGQARLAKGDEYPVDLLFVAPLGRAGLAPSLAGQQLVQHDTQREHIAVGVVQSVRSLGGKIGRRPEVQVDGDGLAAFERGAGDAEVQDLHVAEGREHQVRGLDVAVSEPESAAVGSRRVPGGLQALGGFPDDRQGHAGRELAQGSMHGAHVDAVDVLHDDRPATAEREQAVDPHQGAVVEQTQDPRFVPQASHVGLGLGGVVGHLDGDRLLEPGGTLEDCTVDTSEAAVPEDFLDPVPAAVFGRASRRHSVHVTAVRIRRTASSSWLWL